jgi:2-polyprenyl-3-methyl-5-hydroxy-6-metoxy-1,4-benzoquinol methylase
MIPPLWFRYTRLPPASAYAGKQTEYAPGFTTYASYNYLRGGLIARVKASHFEAALRMTRPWLGRANAIDFGCADGVFLPSLARWFPKVVGIDRDADSVAIAERAVRAVGLPNVRLLCDDGADPDALRAQLQPDRFEVLYTIMTLEHFGEPGRQYESRVELVERLFELLEPNGGMVVGVPNMVGLAFLLQRVALWAGGLHRDEIGLRDTFNAIVHKDTAALEPNWCPETHLGFNHVKLLDALREHTYVLAHRSLLFEETFLLSRKRPT